MIVVPGNRKDIDGDKPGDVAVIAEDIAYPGVGGQAVVLIVDLDGQDVLDFIQSGDVVDEALFLFDEEIYVVLLQGHEIEGEGLDLLAEGGFGKLVGGIAEEDDRRHDHQQEEDDEFVGNAQIGEFLPHVLLSPVRIDWRGRHDDRG